MLTPRNGKCGFLDTLGDINSTITVGGREISNNEFLPTMNCSAHDDEFWWNMFLLGSTPVGKPDGAGGVVEAPVNGVLQRFYTRPDGRLEWEMVWESEPANKVLEIRLRHSGNLEFAKQMLSPEDLAAGHEYNYPAAEGSYAIYGNKRNNKYRAGKIGHIDRFWLKDSMGNFAWVDIDIYPDGAGQEHMVAILPDTFMRNAIYPVLMGPTIGYSNLGALNAPATTDYGRFVSHTAATESGPVSAIHVGAHTVVGEWITGVIQSNPASFSSPNGYSYSAISAKETPAGGGVHTFASITPVSDLVNGTQYCMYIDNNGSGNRWYYDAAAGPAEYDYRITLAWTSVPQNPVTTATVFSSAATYRITAWADYAAVAGPTFNRSRIVNMGASGPQNRSTIANA